MANSHTPDITRPPKDLVARLQALGHPAGETRGTRVVRRHLFDHLLQSLGELLLPRVFTSR